MYYHNDINKLKTAKEKLENEIYDLIKEKVQKFQDSYNITLGQLNLQWSSDPYSANPINPGATYHFQGCSFKLQIDL
jgi:hypothetical protein